MMGRICISPGCILQAIDGGILHNNGAKAFGAASALESAVFLC